MPLAVPVAADGADDPQNAIDDDDEHNREHKPRSSSKPIDTSLALLDYHQRLDVRSHGLATDHVLPDREYILQIHDRLSPQTDSDLAVLIKSHLRCLCLFSIL